MGILSKALAFALPGAFERHPMPWSVHVEDRYGVWIRDKNDDVVVHIHGSIADARVLAMFIVDACAEKKARE